MPLYEHTFLARPDLSVQQAEALVEHFKAVLEENSGSMGRMENWGLRSTAYRMNKNRKAHYLHFNVDASSDAINEMERQMRIHDDIMRYMTIRVEEHEEGPSAMMKKSDDRRGGRGEGRGEGRNDNRGDGPREHRNEKRED